MPRTVEKERNRGDRPVLVSVSADEAQAPGLVHAVHLGQKRVEARYTCQCSGCREDRGGISLGMRSGGALRARLDRAMDDVGSDSQLWLPSQCCMLPHAGHLSGFDPRGSPRRRRQIQVMAVLAQEPELTYASKGSEIKGSRSARRFISSSATAARRPPASQAGPSASPAPYAIAWNMQAPSPGIRTTRGPWAGPGLEDAEAAGLDSHKPSDLVRQK